MKKLLAFALLTAAILVVMDKPQYEFHPPFRGEADFKVIA